MLDFSGRKIRFSGMRDILALPRIAPSEESAMAGDESSSGARGFNPDPASGEMSALMKTHDWSATPLGPPHSWAGSLSSVVGVMLGSRQPMFLVWGEKRILLYNDAFLPLLGGQHAKSLGRPIADVWPHLIHEIDHLLDRARDGRGLSGAEINLSLGRDGPESQMPLAFSCGPILDQGNGVGGLILIGTKTVAQVMAERHLKFRLQLDERLRHITDSREVMEIASEMLGQHLHASRVNYGYIEDTPAGEIFVVERDWTDGKTPSLVGRYRVDGFGAPLIAELKAGRTICLHDAFNNELTAGEGIAATYVAIGARSGITVPLIKRGKMAAALLVHQVEPRHWREDEEILAQQVAERTWDAVERARAETSMRESEERLRDILESINDAFYAVDGNWQFTYINRKSEELWQRSRDDLMGKVYWDEFPETVGGEVYQAHMTAMLERRPVRVEAISQVLDRWIDISIYPTGDGGISVYFRDVTERKKADEHRELLIHELNHRVKNTLATVQSIATQTMRKSDVTGETRADFEARLFALSRAHDVLTRENWEGAALREVVAQATEPYRVVSENRLHCTGPDVRLAPRAALSLAMALQELATNAVKHGALSNETGEIDISWFLDETTDPPRLHLCWQEMRGPPVLPPQRRGFGTRLIERSLAQDLDGNVRMRFDPSGVACIVEAPLPPLQSALPFHLRSARKP